MHSAVRVRTGRWQEKRATRGLRRGLEGPDGREGVRGHVLCRARPWRGLRAGVAPALGFPRSAPAARLHLGEKGRKSKFSYAFLRRELPALNPEVLLFRAHSIEEWLRKDQDWLGRRTNTRKRVLQGKMTKEKSHLPAPTLKQKHQQFLTAVLF